MRRLAPILLLLPLLLAASGPAQQSSNPSLDEQLKQARGDQAAAEAQTARLQKAASAARSEADRLRIEEEAAAEAIEAAEARITGADAQLSIARSFVAAHRRALADEQRPVASLLAGLATMSRRPPLLALADEHSVDALVRVRILLDSTIPAIRARTARLSSELSEGERLQKSAADARSELLLAEQNLGVKRQQFAMLEQKALESASVSGAQALSAGDVAIAAGENVEQLIGAKERDRPALAAANALAALDAAPARPGGAQAPSVRLPFAYELPAVGEVTEGLGAVNASGVRARGLTLETKRGAVVTAPAAGTVKFVGPYGDYDGVLIIDHGGGWLSLLVNVSSELKAGDKVELGETLGQATGPLQVELSQYGRRISAALIAGSSQSLSKDSKGG